MSTSTAISNQMERDHQ